MRHDEALQQVSSPLQIVPAYGRRYPTAERMMKDWAKGKDFKVWNGPYCSVRDLPRMRQDNGRIYICSPLDDITVMLSSE